MGSSNFVGAVAFWRALEHLADPEPQTRLHAMILLAELARGSFAACGGMAYSPQQAECLEYCGLTPIGIRRPGSVGETI
jgi:hypothetical protein